MFFLFLVLYELFVFFINLIYENDLLYKLLRKGKKVKFIEEEMSSLTDFDSETVFYIKNASYFSSEKFDYFKSLFEDFESEKLVFQVYPWYSLIYLCTANRLFFRTPPEKNHVFYVNNRIKSVLRIVLLLIILTFR